MIVKPSDAVAENTTPSGARGAPSKERGAIASFMANEPVRRRLRSRKSGGLRVEALRIVQFFIGEFKTFLRHLLELETIHGDWRRSEIEGLYIATFSLSHHTGRGHRVPVEEAASSSEGIVPTNLAGVEGGGAHF